MAWYKIDPNPIKTLTRKSDPDSFFIKGQITMTPRAGFEINEKCPETYRAIIADCINRGWLVPVAYMTEKEYAWMNLSK